MQHSAGAKLTRPGRSDVLIALGLCAGVELEVVRSGLGPASALVAALASSLFVFRRCAPAVTASALVWVLVLDDALGGVWTEQANSGVVLLLPAFYSVGAYAERRSGELAALAGAPLLVAALLDQPGDATFLIWIAVMPWLAGRAVRRYRIRAASLEQLADRLRDEEAVSGRLAVAEERQRIAVELHDALGHAVSAMALQAAAAHELVTSDPARARRSLEAVQRIGGQVIADLRSVLRILRAPPSPNDEPLPIEPIAPSRRWWPRSLRWSMSADAALALLALVAGEAFTALDPAMAGVRLPVALIQVLAAAAIVLRSHRAATALALALAAMCAEAALIGANPVAPTSLLATVLALYSVGSHATPRVSLPAGIAGVGVPCALALTAGNGDLADVAVIAPLFGLPWLAGRAARAWRLQAKRLEALTAELRRERDARARLAVVEERTRVAGELHDSIAHAVSVMVLQAGAASEVIATAPGRAREAALAAQQVGRQAVRELKHLIAVLTADGQVELDPPVGLAQLDTLIAQLRRAGLPVRLDIRDAPENLPVGVDVFAYRIVQEALTNALKHAGSVPTTVVLDHRDGTLNVEVLDDGGSDIRTPNLSGSGQGLTGMRERAALFGGTLEAGPREEGGYAVRARLATRHAVP
jgi:signal transduction histidine kinase